MFYLNAYAPGADCNFDAPRVVTSLMPLHRPHFLPPVLPPLLIATKGGTPLRVLHLQLFGGSSKHVDQIHVVRCQ